MVPTSRKDCKEKKVLLRKDIKLGNYYLVVHMKWSKTIQIGERVLETPLIAIPSSVLCPVLAYKRMCKKVGAKKSDPIFTLPDNLAELIRCFKVDLDY